MTLLVKPCIGRNGFLVGLVTHIVLRGIAGIVDNLAGDSHTGGRIPHSYNTKNAK